MVLIHTDRRTHADGDVRHAAIGDVAHLTRAAHRVTVLETLAAAPRSRTELREVTGMSSSTIGRTLREFENRCWIERTGHSYETTELGSFVASAIREAIDRIELERTLRDVWDWLPAEVRSLRLETLSDATVTVAATDAPYRPVNRFVTLLEETETFRFLGSDVALLEPCRDELRERVLAGMQTEVIDPPRAARYVLEAYPDHCVGPLESGNLTILLHENVPDYGIAIFDDRAAICGYDSQTGTVRVLIDTDADTVRAWAESTYDSYRRESRPLRSLAIQ